MMTNSMHITFLRTKLCNTSIVFTFNILRIKPSETDSMSRNINTNLNILNIEYKVYLSSHGLAIVIISSCLQEEKSCLYGRFDKLFKMEK